MGTSWAQIPGGKGANQAVAAARSGGETWMVGRLGQDSFGNTLLESLMRNPVNIDHVEMQQDAPTGIAAIIVDGSGRNRITVISGANFTNPRRRHRTSSSSDCSLLRPAHAA